MLSDFLHPGPLRVKYGTTVFVRRSGAGATAKKKQPSIKKVSEAERKEEEDDPTHYFGQETSSGGGDWMQVSGYSDATTNKVHIIAGLIFVHTIFVQNG